MQTYTIQNTTINVVNGELSEQGVISTIEMFKQKYPDRNFITFTFKVDGDYLDVSYEFISKPVERIRRITGYLVGTLDRFNDAKRAEVNDRVKHL